MKRNLILFSLIATASMLILSACTTTSATPPAITETETVNSTTVSEGRLLPVSWLDQSLSLSGTVDTVEVNDGDLVTAGQPLVTLTESAESELAVARAEEEVMAAQQALDSVLNRAELSRAQAQLSVLDALDALDAAQSDYDANDSEENRILLDIASANFALAEQELASMGNSTYANADLLAAAESRLTSAQAALASAHALSDAHTLTSSMDGTVVDLDLQHGQQVVAGTPVITIADFSSWVVKTENLTESQITLISVGDTVEVVLDALPGVKLTGEVSHINARFEEKRGDITYTVTITINESNPAMRWGMTAAVYFQP